MSYKVYPWQLSTWAMLKQQQDKMHHAILLSGEQGIGKQHFANTLAQSLLCQQPSQEGFACGECQSCHWFSNQTHPDFKLVSAENDDEDDDKKSTSKKTQISVHQIRTLNDFLALSSHQGKKVVLINPAEDMNLAATNALLKMLEEPPNNAFFILVTHSSKRLLATIRSRCQQVNMQCPDSEIGQRWLKQEGLSVSSQQLRYVGGSPLKAIQQEDYDDCMRLVKSLMDGRLMDISQAVNFCQSIGMAKSVDVLQKWLHDLLSTTNNLPARYHEISAEKLTTLAKQLEPSRGFDLLDQLNYFRRHAQHPLNQELQFESICLNYTKIFKEAA